MIVQLWMVAFTIELLSVTELTTQFIDSIPRGSMPKTLPEVKLIKYDVPYNVTVNTSRTEFPFLVPQETDRSLSVTVTPCNSRIDWNLMFIPQTKNNGTLKLGHIKTSELGQFIVGFTAVPTSMTYVYEKAYRGLYVITAQSVDGESQVEFYVTLKKKSQIQPFEFGPNVIKIKKEGQKVSLRWNLSRIDHHLITYTLVISTSKIYMNLCQAVSQLKEKNILSYLNYSDYDSTHFDDDRLEIHDLGFSTNYTLTDLVYNKTYYFTVFALNRSRMSTQYANITYKHERFKSIGLKDARPQSIDLKALGGKALFRYKVGNRAGIENPKTLYWYVMPCNGVVNVEIHCKKKLLMQKRVFGYEKLVLNNITQGDRYVLKVETVSADETQRVRSIEAMATVRPHMFPMPDMPSDLRIRQYVKSNDCHSVTIGWLPAKSDTDLWYCVYVQKNTHNNNVDFLDKPDQCESSYANGRRRNTVNYRRKIRCYTVDKGKVKIEKLLKLKSSTAYTIQVTVTKPRGRTLSYDLLRLDTNSCELN